MDKNEILDEILIKSLDFRRKDIYPKKKPEWAIQYLRPVQDIKKALAEAYEAGSRRGFGLAANLLLGLMQQYPDGRPTANDIAKLLERFKELSRAE